MSLTVGLGQIGDGFNVCDRKMCIGEMYRVIWQCTFRFVRQMNLTQVESRLIIIYYLRNGRIFFSYIEPHRRERKEYIFEVFLLKKIVSC